MRLDVLIPTRDRAPLLSRALESLVAADRPDGLSVGVTVIDNGSIDRTRAVVESFVPRFADLQYVYEPNPGRCRALNAGIASTHGDLVGIIDDDEEVDRRWLLTAAAAFQDPTTDFIGGPYLPRWGGDRPVWLGRWYGSVIGWVESGEVIRQFGPPFEAMLMGGNAVIRRSVLERVGPYSLDLGRTPGKRLLSCEDDDMFARLLAIGARGFYRPDLIIHHYVAPERLTKRYFRRWCFWRGVSLGVLDKRRPAAVPYLLGIPRYVIGLAVRGTIETARLLMGPPQPARIFKNELAWWDLAGFAYGKHASGLDRLLSRITNGRETPGAPPKELLPSAVTKSHRGGSSPLTTDQTPQL